MPSKLLHMSGCQVDSERYDNETRGGGMGKMTVGKFDIYHLFTTAFLKVEKLANRHSSQQRYQKIMQNLV